MDVAPSEDTYDHSCWSTEREKLVAALENSGLRYYRGGRVMPSNQVTAETATSRPSEWNGKPQSLDELLHVIVRHLPRAIHPLAYRRQGVESLSFRSEYDIQDLLHAMLRPWVSDIRAEEFTPSYAGSSTRMDFLLPRHKLVIETKRVRDRSHAKALRDELIIDIENYRRHPDCASLWCVIYDPDQFIENPTGMADDLSGDRITPDGAISVKAMVVSG